MRGIAAGPIKKSVANNDGFFVVLELLEKTLTDQISLWGCFEMDRKGTREKRLALNERFMVALQLARAIEYLHSQNIIHFVKTAWCCARSSELETTRQRKSHSDQSVCTVDVYSLGVSVVVGRWK